jgi:acyl carrier protein
MTRDEIFREIRDIFLAPVTSWLPKTEDATWESMGLDSLDVVELVMQVEEEYEIEITDNEMEGITLAGLITIIKAKI